MTCRRWVRWMYSFLDETLTKEQILEMKAHLSGCSDCRERYRQEGLMTGLMMEAKELEPPVYRERSDRRLAMPTYWRRPLGWALASLLLVVGGLFFIRFPSKQEAYTLSQEEMEIMVQGLYEVRRDPCADLKYARSDWIRLDKRGSVR